jgi:hypothetical protein
MLVRTGIHLVKFWFSVSQGEQRTRFAIRQVDPVRQWKLSPMDLRSLDKWDEYTEAKEAMFFYTDTADAPWTVVKSNDKKRARLQAIRHVLSRFDYADKDAEVVGTPTRRSSARRRWPWRGPKCPREYSRVSSDVKAVVVEPPRSLTWPYT